MERNTDAEPPRNALLPPNAPDLSRRLLELATMQRDQALQLSLATDAAHQLALHAHQLTRQALELLEGGRS